MRWKRDKPDPPMPALPNHGLNASAQVEFETCVLDFAAALYAETERLEAGQSSTAGGPEITSSMVHDANLLVRRGYHKPRQSGRVVTAHLTSAAALIGVGVVTNHLDKLFAQIAFPILVVVALTTGFYALSKEAR